MSDSVISLSQGRQGTAAQPGGTFQALVALSLLNSADLIR